MLQDTDIKIEVTDRGNFAANIHFLSKIGLVKEDNLILEIGCGAGRMVDYLNQNGFNIVGFDFSKTTIQKNRIQYHGTQQWLIASGDRLPFKDSSFDTVMSFDVFEHIPDSRKHLSEVRRILRPNGSYLFQTPNKLTNMPFEIVKNRSLTKHKEYHCSLKTFWSLKKILRDCEFGFEFYDIPVMNAFVQQKIKKVFGCVGTYGLRLINPDRLPLPMRTNFYVYGVKK